jgi:hypothetical protein
MKGFLTMAKLPDCTPRLHKEAKDGYKSSSVKLLKRLIESLKENGNLSETEKSYLLECLEKTVASKPENANRGFNLSYPRGKQKMDTDLRDYRAAQLMRNTEKLGISYEDRLRSAADEINRDFPMSQIDVKTVEKAYSDYTKNKFKAL